MININIMFHKKIIKIIYLTTLILFYSKLLANETSLNDNIVIHKKPQNISQLVVKDFNFNDVDLNEEKGNIVIINFWATWCAPCKKEMPSLEALSNTMPELRIFPVNTEKPDLKKTKKFYEEVGLKKLQIYFDPEFKVVKTLGLRGLPTSIIINRDSKEVGRVIGEIDFNEKSFVEYLRSL